MMITIAESAEWIICLLLSVGREKFKVYQSEAELGWGGGCVGGWLVLAATEVYQ